MWYTAIIDKIKQVVETNNRLSATYDYQIKNYDTYPTATIFPDDTTEVVFDTAYNSSTYTIRVRVADRNVDIENTEKNLRIICDELMAQLRQMPLDNTIQRVVFWINWWWTDDEEPLRVFEIKCDCTQLNAI